MQHTVQKLANPLYRRVICCICNQAFVVSFHNIEKILLGHHCTPFPNPKLIFSNGNATTSHLQP